MPLLPRKSLEPQQPVHLKERRIPAHLDSVQPVLATTAVRKDTFHEVALSDKAATQLEVTEMGKLYARMESAREQEVAPQCT